MEFPGLRYIFTRAIFLILAVIAGIHGLDFAKKLQRRATVTRELKALTSDSSFFQQFYAEDARKSLVRAVGLVAEATTLGVSADDAINRGLGIKTEFFKNEYEEEEPPVREKIIRTCLRSNFDNILKLGYPLDKATVASMKSGELPPIPAGPQQGTLPHIVNLIPPTLSPGMEKVIANWEIRPPRGEDVKPTDVEIAAAKELAKDLALAGIIEESVSQHILNGLGKP